MTTFKVTLAILVLFISMLALSMHSAANNSIIRGGDYYNSQRKNKTISSGRSNGSFLFAKNNERQRDFFLQVDVDTGSFMKIDQYLPNSDGLTLDEATRTIYARSSAFVYSFDVDKMTLTKTFPIANRMQIVDLHFDKGFNTLVGIVDKKYGNYGFVKIDPKSGDIKVVLEFQGPFQKTAYDPINHMYYLTSDGVTNTISQFNMTHSKLQRTYSIPTRVTGMAVDGRSNTLYACSQRDSHYRFAKLDLDSGKMNEFTTELPGRVVSLGALDAERGIYYGCTRIQEITHHLVEINVKNGEFTTKTLPASFYDSIFIPAKK